LARQCLQQTTKRVDPGLAKELRGLKQTVQSSRYQALENFLETEQWLEADQETYRLMIITVNKEEGQWFDRVDLENFPCEDLQALDKIWLLYSHGKWGFSAQKRIWQECGSPESSGEDWDRFCIKVGWKAPRTKRYLNYGELKAKPELSPTGELPIGVNVFVSGEFGKGFSALAQRLEICGMPEV
jgi:GUN4-like